MTRRALAILAILGLFTTSCQALNQTVKGIQSQTTGLNRVVELYDYSGNKVGRWASNTVIDAESGLVTFFDSTGNRVLVSGGILVSTEY